MENKAIFPNGMENKLIKNMNIDMIVDYLLKYFEVNNITIDNVNDEVTRVIKFFETEAGACLYKAIETVKYWDTFDVILPEDIGSVIYTISKQNELIINENVEFLYKVGDDNYNLNNLYIFECTCYSLWKKYIPADEYFNLPLYAKPLIVTNVVKLIEKVSDIKAVINYNHMLTYRILEVDDIKYTIAACLYNIFKNHEDPIIAYIVKSLHDIFNILYVEMYTVPKLNIVVDKLLDFLNSTNNIINNVNIYNTEAMYDNDIINILTRIYLVAKEYMNKYNRIPQKVWLLAISYDLAIYIARNKNIFINIILKAVENNTLHIYDNMPIGEIDFRVLHTIFKFDCIDGVHTEIAENLPWDFVYFFIRYVLKNINDNKLTMTDYNMIGSYGIYLYHYYFHVYGLNKDNLDETIINAYNSFIEFINQYIPNKKNITPNNIYVIIKDIMMRRLYEKIIEHEPVEKELLQSNIPFKYCDEVYIPSYIESLIEYVEGDNKINKKTCFTDIIINYDGYTMRSIKEGSLLHLLFGFFTNCCQRFDGVGHLAAVSAYLEDVSTTYVVIDPNNKIIAGSLVWFDYNARACVIDNIEVAPANFSKTKIIEYIYKLFCKEIIKRKYNVYCGFSNNDVNLRNIGFSQNYTFNNFNHPKYYYDGDSCNLHKYINELDTIEVIKGFEELRNRTDVLDRIINIEATAYPEDLRTFETADDILDYFTYNLPIVIVGNNFYMLSSIDTSNNTLYIEDFASLNGNGLGNNLFGFLKVFKNILVRYNPDKIEADLRESTSYKFVPFFEKLGYKLAKDETEDRDGEIFHIVVFEKENN